MVLSTVIYFISLQVLHWSVWLDVANNNKWNLQFKIFEVIFCLCALRLKTSKQILRHLNSIKMNCLIVFCKNFLSGFVIYYVIQYSERHRLSYFIMELQVSGFRKLVRYNLNKKKILRYDTVQILRKLSFLFQRTLLILNELAYVCILSLFDQISLSFNFLLCIKKCSADQIRCF